MASKVKVEISKTCLSFLLRDNANSDGDQEGFLLGQVIQVKGRDINDQDAEQATETTVIKITSHMCMSRACIFYNPVGRIGPEKIENVLGPFKNKVVGYFDFKREYPIETGTKPTFRTTSLFFNLCKWLSTNQSQAPRTPANQRGMPATQEVQPANEGTLMVLRQHHSASKAIINNTYCFYRFNNDKLEKIGSSIPNLGDTSHSLYVSDPPVMGIDDIIRQNLTEMPVMAPENMPVVRMHEALMAELREAGNQVDVAESHLKDQAERYEDFKNRRMLLEVQIAELKKKEDEELLLSDLAKDVKVEPHDLEDLEDPPPPSASSTPKVNQTSSASSVTPKTPNVCILTTSSGSKARVKQELKPFRVKQEPRWNTSEEHPKIKQEQRAKPQVKQEVVEEDILTSDAVMSNPGEEKSAMGNKNQSPVLARKTRGNKMSLKK